MKSLLSFIKKRTGFLLFIGLVILPLFLVFTPSIVVWANGSKKSFNNTSEVPHKKVGIVLGTTAKVAGRDNLYFKYRMDAAAELYQAGKVDCFIVSGANPSAYYNEPKAMAEAMVTLGIPKDIIIKDYAGFRTLDSVFRAQKVFGVEEAIFVSQAFHNHRAIFIADHIGMNASGYNSKDVPSSHGLRIRAREVLARVKMFLDLHILKTQPKFLGVKQKLPV